MFEYVHRSHDRLVVFDYYAPLATLQWVGKGREDSHFDLPTAGSDYMLGMDNLFPVGQLCAFPFCALE